MRVPSVVARDSRPYDGAERDGRGPRPRTARPPLLRPTDVLTYQHTRRDVDKQIILQKMYAVPTGKRRIARVLTT